MSLILIGSLKYIILAVELVVESNRRVAKKYFFGAE